MKLERISPPTQARTGLSETGLDRPRIVIFGDSHMHALQEALKTRDEPTGVSIEARRLLKTKGEGATVGAPTSVRERLRRFASSIWQGGRSPDDETRPHILGDTSFAQFLAIAKSLAPQDILVSAVGGNQHAVYSTIQHPVPFDFNFPEDVATPGGEGVEVIPFGPLYDHFEEGLRKGDGATLAALKGATRARVVHLMAPPPKRDGAFIQRNHDTHFAAEGIDDLGVSSAALRMKFWKLQNRALARICADLWIELLAPPADACDDEGFLAEPFYARDATHANAAYGELVIGQLERLAAASVP